MNLQAPKFVQNEAIQNNDIPLSNKYPFKTIETMKKCVKHV